MASVVIHMCVASEINKKIKVKNYDDFLLGSIAPDIPNVYMDEIPIGKLQELLDSASLIIENSKEHKEYLFDIYEIKKYIDYSVDIICNDIFKRQLTKNM